MTFRRRKAHRDRWSVKFRDFWWEAHYQHSRSW